MYNQEQDSSREHRCLFLKAFKLSFLGISTSAFCLFHLVVTHLIYFVYKMVSLIIGSLGLFCNFLLRTLLFVGGFLTGAGTTVDNTEGGGDGRELFLSD